MNKQQQKMAIELLRRACITVDYFDHNGELSCKIQDLFREIGEEKIFNDNYVPIPDVKGPKKS